MPELFREETSALGKLAIILVIVPAAVVLFIIHPEHLGGVLIPFAIILSIPLFFAKMTTVITLDAIKVSFGYITLFKKIIPLAEIQSSEIVTFRPIWNFGGWGIRCGRFRGERTSCLSMSGNKGVLLTLTKETTACLFKSKKLIIASRTPEKLQETLMAL